MQGYTGAPYLIFLYPYMIDDPYIHLPRDLIIPPADKFDKRHCIVAQPLHYTTSNGKTHTCPVNFVSDGGSIHTVVGWGLASTPYRDFLPAFLIHDHMCGIAYEMKAESKRMKKAGYINKALNKLNEAKDFRKYADKTLREGSQWLGGGKIKALNIYMAVRAGAKFCGL